MAGGTERGARLFGAAESVCEALDIEIDPADRPDYDRAVAGARSALGEARFATAWASGRTLTLDEALALALEVTEQTRDREAKRQRTGASV